MKIAQGTIAWAEVDDPKGRKRKMRPIVIITKTPEIALDRPIVAVAITTTYPDPPTDEYVELPWMRSCHPATGLSKRSAAACKWLISVKPSEIKEIRGYVPTKYLLQIVRNVRRLNA